MPKISVIVPVYNVEDFLVKCLDSIALQSFHDFEVLIVDDGSTDNSSAIAKDYEEKYDQFRVITQENGGLGAARNTGIEAAKGDYFLFVDSDDYIDKDTMELLYEKVQKTNADLILFDMAIEELDGHISAVTKGYTQHKNDMTLEKYPDLMLATPHTGNKLFHRDLFMNTGIRFPSRAWYEDLRTIPKILTFAKHIEYIDKPFYKYLQRPGSIMHSKNIERNSEIIDAIDDVITYYKEHDLFKRYYHILEYLAIDHIFILASVRVIKMDRKHPLLKQFKEYVEKQFPNYKKNPFLVRLNKKQKIVFKCFATGNYFILSKLFK